MKKMGGTILSIDVGGTHVKMMTDKSRIKRDFASGPGLTAKSMVAQVKQLTKDWSYDAVSVGYPGPVARNPRLNEPHNLGRGWKGFDFSRAFGRPAKVVNDALMQALGGYRGGKMLFLGLGTELGSARLGSAMIADGVLLPMELAGPSKGKRFEYFVGAAGLKRHGKRKWAVYVEDVVDRLVGALEPDYVIIGGGNASKIGTLPNTCHLGKER